MAALEYGGAGARPARLPAPHASQACGQPPPSSGKLGPLCCAPPGSSIEAATCHLTMAARLSASRSSTVVGSTAVSSTPKAPAPAWAAASGAGA